jgi:hypothetical protein
VSDTPKTDEELVDALIGTAVREGLAATGLDPAADLDRAVESTQACRDALLRRLARLTAALRAAETGLLALDQHHTEAHHGGVLAELDERVADGLLACREVLDEDRAPAGPEGNDQP